MNKNLKHFILFFILSTVAYSQGHLNTILGYPDSLGFIIERPQYVISYSDKLNSARWASWYIDKDCYGPVKRFSGQFITDTTLPENYTVIRHSDYTNSGFDRGHLVRSEERTQTVEDNKATFFLTNVIPQRPELNRNIWLQLENYCKKLAKEESKQLFVVAGGEYSNKPRRINKKVAIPRNCWKVVLVLDSGKTVNDIDTNTQIIAVMMPNNKRIKKTENWEKFLTTAREIEQSTGFNFFSNINFDIQEIIENRKYRFTVVEEQ